jgi:hypothetical protein
MIFCTGTRISDLEIRVGNFIETPASAYRLCTTQHVLPMYHTTRTNPSAVSGYSDLQQARQGALCAHSTHDARSSRLLRSVRDHIQFVGK